MLRKRKLVVAGRTGVGRVCLDPVQHVSRGSAMFPRELASAQKSEVWRACLGATWGAERPV
uniref:Uncharacterized protein n=1 Tax=Hyaloperonospora arabidopsidis (strain Emoy2) TaxID=559515 RepID=M4BQU0_HYAAE